MSPVPRTALVPFFQAMKKVLGPQAATTRVSVAGGLYLQEQGIRDTNLDIDVVIKGQPPIYRRGLQDGTVKADKAFTPNLEKICGVTYRDPMSRRVIPIDIINERVTKFMPAGVFLDQLEETEIPWPQPDEVIKMKIYSASERFMDQKRIRDLEAIKALTDKFGTSMSYDNDAERAAIKAALEACLPQYLEFKTEWSEEQWKAKLGLI